MSNPETPVNTTENEAAKFKFIRPLTDVVKNNKDLALLGAGIVTFPLIILALGNYPTQDKQILRVVPKIIKQKLQH